MKQVIQSVCCLVILLLPAAATVCAQTAPLSLETCQELARQNYPLVKQHALIARSRDYAVQHISKGYLPQVSVSGQASYQSEVTQIPIQLPGVNIPVLSKDQYKLYGELTQTIFDGGVIRQQKEAQSAAAMMEEQQLEVECYRIEEQVNQLFFGILLVDEQLRQHALLRDDIRLGLGKAQAAVANGTAFRSSADVLQAELLKAGQRTTELQAARKAYLGMLGLFINRELGAQTVLLRPPAPSPAPEIKRPELQLYDYRSSNLDVQGKLLTARNLPKLNFFLQGGYGRPALNMLSNDFETYYVGGLRLHIPISGLYTLRKDRAMLDISREQIAVQRENFLFHTSITLTQQDAEIARLHELLASDDEIISLRGRVKTTAAAQLEHGVINASDYLREVNAEDNARQSKILHEIQLLMAQYNRQVTTGK